MVPQSKLVVYGESSTVTGLDTITFADAPNNCTRVEYEADIRLKGVLALATWWVTPDLKKLAAEAKSGLEAAWAGGKQNAAPAGAGGEQAGAKGSEGGSG